VTGLPPDRAAICEPPDAQPEHPGFTERSAGSGRAADAWELAGGRRLRDLAAGPAGKLITTAFRVSPRQDRSMDTVERLLAAGEAIIRRTGRLDRLTIDMIAEEAGVTPQAAYRYFRDIHDLILLAVRRTQAIGHERLFAAITARRFDGWADLANLAVAFVIQNFQALARLPVAIREPIARDYHDICYDQLWTLGEATLAAMRGRGDHCAGVDAAQLGSALAAVVAVTKLLFLNDTALLGQACAQQRMVGIFLRVLDATPGQCAGASGAAAKTDFFNISALD